MENNKNMHIVCTYNISLSLKCKAKEIIFDLKVPTSRVLASPSGMGKADNVIVK